MSEILFFMNFYCCRYHTEEGHWDAEDDCCERVCRLFILLLSLKPKVIKILKDYSGNLNYKMV